MKHEYRKIVENTRRACAIYLVNTSYMQRQRKWILKWYLRYKINNDFIIHFHGEKNREIISNIYSQMNGKLLSFRIGKCFWPLCCCCCCYSLCSNNKFQAKNKMRKTSKKIKINKNRKQAK